MNKSEQLKPGSHVPEVDFRVRTGDDWISLKTDEIFSDKTVVIFALPGAFTPTCSSTHLPGYVALSSSLKAA
jgi:peroxiredoxin